MDKPFTYEKHKQTISLDKQYYNVIHYTPRLSSSEREQKKRLVGRRLYDVFHKYN